MTPTRFFVAAALAALALPLAGLPTTTASAAGETCRGQAATIVGTPGKSLDGTPGDDVIVSNGAYFVDAGKGDDLVCTTNSPRSSLDVRGGQGDDVVDRSGDTKVSDITIFLGNGDDTFYGASSAEFVITDGGADKVFGGGGDDDVFAGVSKQPVTAQIDVPGSGGRVTLDGPPSAEFTLDGGAGGTVLLGLTQLPGGGTWTFDSGAGTIDYDGAPSGTFAGVGSFEFDSDSSKLIPGNVRYLGTDAVDDVSVDGSNLSGDFGGGNDDVTIGCSNKQAAKPATTPSLDAGAGTDAVGLFQCEGTVDLSKKLVSTPDGDLNLPVLGFENASLDDDGTLIGDGGPNKLSHYGCYATIDGRGGRDRIVTDDDNGETCDVRGGKVLLKGGAGNDVLRARTDHRVEMRGGTGNDTAIGQGRTGGSNPRQHRCRAEHRVACRAF